ncbi:MAG: 5'-deoxynucleotidase [Firmicutes bacterium]|nr:5'-deoxynucleotidase [Bacillota bacterium]
MKNIRRWGLMRSFREENVQEHSLQVAMFAHALALLENDLYGGSFDPEHVMAIAVYHETSEVITGDLVTPIKYYNEEIRSAYKHIEALAEERMLSMLPENLEKKIRPLVQPEDVKEKQLVKAADTLAAYTKCLEEVRSGNREFEKASEKLRQSIESMSRDWKLQSVSYFMKEFIPSFEVTLDELN